MMPMTPLQSWAFLALVSLIVVGLGLAATHGLDAIERLTARRADEGEAVDDPDALDDEARPDAEPEPSYPPLALVPSGTEPDQGPPQVYDWAVQGI